MQNVEILELHFEFIDSMTRLIIGFGKFFWTEIPFLEILYTVHWKFRIDQYRLMSPWE